MPHECNTCGEIYPDGCEDILSGCKSCGSKKFQYIGEHPEDTEESPRLKPSTQKEDNSQRAARSEVVSKDELPPRMDLNRSNTSEENSNPQSEEQIPGSPVMSEERDVKDIKDILNDQFEGIKIIRPGEYEINITKLFEGDSHIITVHEDGKFIVNVPKTFEDS